MQQTFLKCRNETANGPSIARSDAEYTLNVAIVYQDAPTRQWAGQVLDRLAELVGEEAVHCTEWKISDLSEPGTYSEGVAALARADVIVVSLHESARLPSVFYLWVSLWLQVRSGLTGALVALVAQAEGFSDGARETRRYLCAVASQGRLELLESNQPNEPIPCLREDTFQWVRAA
jgi:hypothetical protein